MVKGFSVSNNRKKKAKKIEAILEDFLGKKIVGLKILEVGCGSGIIAGYFSKNNEVYAVDIENKLENGTEKVIFSQINDEKLPFESEKFDIIISNHVIEHVQNQDLHLSEIKRCLKNDGVFYFATPNKNFPVEPHYKVPFIHYFGKNLFHKTLKILGKYKEDLDLLSYSKQIKFLNKFFEIKKEYTGEVIKNNEKYFFGKIPLLNKLPLSLINKLVFLSETNIFICNKK